MAQLGNTERLTYAAKNFRTGLVDVVAWGIKSNGSVIGPLPMTEFSDSHFLGVYYYDLATQLTDPEGEWTFVISSPTEGIKSPVKVDFEVFGGGSSGGGSDVTLEGFVEEVQEVVGCVDYNEIVGFVEEAS